jgi:uncharacterized LabA/DUF88 family protein
LIVSDKAKRFEPKGEKPMEKVIFFLDFANINRVASDKGIDLDYENLLDYISEGRFLVDAHCYVPIDPRNEHRLDRKLEQLWRSRYIVTTKVGSIAGDGYKCNFDVEITMDILRVAYQVKPDIIVIGTGDSDFVPLVQELRKSGIRVEVASFEASAARDMILKCSGFISLDYYLREWLNKSHETSSTKSFQPVDDETQDYQNVLARSQQLTESENEPVDNLMKNKQPGDDEQSVLGESSFKTKRSSPEKGMKVRSVRPVHQSKEA